MVVFFTAKWIAKLGEVTRRYRMALHAVTDGPMVLGKVIGSKKAIQPGKMNRKVYVNGGILNPVMPMMKPGSDEELLEDRKAPTHVRVNES